MNPAVVESQYRPSALSRLRDRIAGAEKDGGFTLIETLAVMVIIGLLAAITIPQIAKWREKAYVAGMKSDAHNLALAIEADYTQDQSYPDDVDKSWAEDHGVELNSYSKIENYSDHGITDSRQVEGFFSFRIGSDKTDVTVTYDSQDGGLSVD